MSSAENARIRWKVVTSAVTAVVSITLVLFMLGVIGLLMFNARHITQYIREHLTISLTLQPASTSEQVAGLQEQIAAMPFARDVKYISAEEAARIMQKELGEDFLDMLQYNPLSSTLDVYMNADYAHPDSMAVAARQLEELPIVHDTYYQQTLVKSLSSYVRKISAGLLCFALLLMLVAIVLINNTIRLTIYARRFVIYNMQLVGATHAFIRRPLVLRGLLQGLLSALLAMLLLSGLMYAVNKYLVSIFSLSDWPIWGSVFAVLLLLGLLLCAVSTALSVNRFLKTSLDKLYA